MKNMNIIANIVAAGVERDPDLDVLTFVGVGLEEEVRTYQQLWNNSQRIAKSLKDKGIQAGDRVALLMQNHPEFVETMIAGSILGAVMVPIDPRTKGEKLAFMLNDAGCLGIVCADYSLSTLLECVEQVSSLVLVYVVGSDWVPDTNSSITPVSLAEVLKGPVPELEVQANDDFAPMQIMYTSGTTGDPKGVIVRNARFGFVANQGEAVFGYKGDDRPYTGLSLTHGNAQFLTLAPSLKMGLRAVISQRFTKSRLWEIIRHYGCTTFSLLGGMVTAIYSEPPKESDNDNSIRLVISAGMPGALWNDFAKRFDVEIFEFYGAMEGGMTINPPGEGPVGSCGKVPPMLIAKVVDDDGQEVPPGTPGEILFKPADGSSAKVDYFNNSEASEAKTLGGWLHSGDVVIMDAEGWVFYQYRKGGGIRHNGDFINPAFLEKVVAEHPNVSDLSVYGVPAASGAPGENDIVVAIIPENSSCFDPQSVFEWCRGKLENNMIPQYIHILEELPKTATEKVQTRFLQQQFSHGSERIYSDLNGR